MKEYIFVESYIEKFRKLNKLDPLKFGSNLTLISGHNGVGKSSLLALFSSLTGTSQKRNNNEPFYPEFNDYFLINENEEFSDYRIINKFINNKKNIVFYNRVSFNDYRETNRGIRPIPRITKDPNSDQLIKDAVELAKTELGISGSSRIPIPTIYISLSRLLPPGEANIISKTLSKNTTIYQNKYYEIYREWYNFVINDSIDNSQNIIETMNKTVTDSEKLFMPLIDSYANTQSAGQDNLGTIISALIDFYSLSKQPGYSGGFLFIDELEATFHPSASIKLLELLNLVSEDLDLQIVFTSHSLTMIKEMVRLQNKDESKYKINYLKGIRDPFLTSIIDYENLKVDLFDEISSISPKIKVYCEDESTVWLFKQILSITSILQKKGPAVELDILPIYLGCNQLEQLPKYDQHFKSVLIVLDGDAKSKEKITIKHWVEDKNFEKSKTPKKFSKNIIALPSFLAPEEFIYTIIFEYCTKYTPYQDFWRGLDRNQDTTNFTSERIQKKFLVADEDLSLDYLKSKSDELFKFAEQTQILTHYFEKNIDIFDSFLINLNNAVENIQKIVKSNSY